MNLETSRAGNIEEFIQETIHIKRLENTTEEDFKN